MGTDDVPDDENIALAAEHVPHALRRQHPALIIIRGGERNEMNRIQTRINDGTRNLQLGESVNGRNQVLAVHRRDHDPLHMAGDGVVNNFDLAGTVGFPIRSVPNNFVADNPCRPLAPRPGRTARKPCWSTWG